MNIHAYCLLRCCILMAFLSGSSALSAQHFRMTNFTVKDGLPSSEVYCMLQDQQGYIWFGTDRGAVRYDGYRFQTFTTDQGLPDNTVFEMYEDQQGRIWFATYSPLLCYFEKGKIAPYKFNPQIEAHKFKVSPKSSLYVSEAGEVKIGTILYGLLNIGTKGSLSLQGIIGNATFFQEDGHLLLAIRTADQEDTDSRYMAYPDLKTEGVQIEAAAGKWASEEVTYSPNKYTAGATFSDAHNCYLGVGKALYHYKNGQKVSTYSLPHPVSFIYYSEDDRLWLGYLAGGVQVMDLKTHRMLPLQFPQLDGKTVTSILKDQEGGHWLTTTQQGVFYVPSLNIRFLPFSGINANQTIDDLKCKNDSVALLSKGSQQIVEITASENKPWNLRALLSVNNASQLHWNGKNNVLTVANQNVYIYENGKWMSFYEGAVNRGAKAMIGRQDGSVWAGGRNGLYAIWRDRVERMYPDIDNFEIWQLIEDAAGNLWMGTLNGLCKLDSRGNLHREFAHPDLKKRITALGQLPDGRLVAGTLGAGVLVIDGDSVLKISTEEGLRTNLVNCLGVDDKGRIWVGSGRGLNRIGFPVGHPPVVESLGPGNGLPFLEIQKLSISRRNVWLAGPSGVAVLDQEVWPKGPPAPHTRLRWINVNGRDTLPANLLELDHRHNDLNFGFISLHYRREGPLNYRYRLRGLDQGWRYTQDTVVSYPALQPGAYTFEVAARNEAGQWSEPPARSEIKVHPPYWQRWWFLPALLLLLAVIAALISSYFIRQSRQKWEREKDLEKWKLKALRARMDPHFTFNTLNTIQAYISTHDTIAAEKYLNKFARLVRMVLHQSDAETISLGNEKETLGLYLDLEQMRFEDQFVYTIEIDPSLAAESIQIPGMLIQPFAENAILHGLLPKGGGGLLHIHFADHGEEMCCTIRDNGIGRSRAQQRKRNMLRPHKSAGLDLVRSRIQLLYPAKNTSEKIIIRDLFHPDETPAGTLVTFYIPIKML